MYMYTYIVHENSEINGILITRHLQFYKHTHTHIYFLYFTSSSTFTEYLLYDWPFTRDSNNETSSVLEKLPNQATLL